MNDLALVQALFSRVWLPHQQLPIGRPSSLVKRRSTAAIVSEAVGQLEPKPKPKPKPKPELELDQLSDQKLASSSVQRQPTQQPVKVQPGSLPPKPMAILAVEAPENFHIAVTMMAPGWGLVAPLLPRQGGLSGDDYLLLSNLTGAIRQLLHLPKLQVDFDFFRWPPGRGVAKGLDVQGMGLSALKGFLHKLALQKQCSWLVFDPQFARFCFQKSEIQAFTVLPRGQQHLVVAPSLSVIKRDSALKKQLWLQLKSLIVE